MSRISEFAEKQNAYNTRIAASIDAVKADILELNRKIDAHQEDPEDQAKLDALVTGGEELAKKVEDLDAMTPPVIPPVVE